MHIAHICPRFKEVHGGGEPVLFNLLNELCRQGIHNTVYTYNFPESMQNSIDQRVNLKLLPHFFERTFTNVLVAGLYDLACSSLLTFYCFNQQTDILCFHTENTIPTLFFYKILRGKKPKLYFCFQPPRFAYDTTQETAHAGGKVLGTFVPSFKAIYRPFDKITVKFADRVATFSNGYKKWIEDIYAIKDVAVLPPGVRIPRRIKKLTNKELPIDLINNQSNVLISIGKLVHWKRIDRLIDITARVQKKMDDVYLLIVGDGPCYASLKQQVHELGLEENIIFCGYVSAEEIFSYCSVSDLLILLEQNASFGLSLIEANASGVPVMAFEGGGPSDIIEHRKNGFLLPQNISDENITELITEYLSNEKTIIQMRNHSRNIAEKYTWERFAEMFFDVAHNVFLNKNSSIDRVSR